MLHNNNINVNENNKKTITPAQNIAQLGYRAWNAIGKRVVFGPITAAMGLSIPQSIKPGAIAGIVTFHDYVGAHLTRAILSPGDFFTVANKAAHPAHLLMTAAVAGVGIGVAYRFDYCGSLLEKGSDALYGSLCEDPLLSNTIWGGAGLLAKGLIAYVILGAKDRYPAVNPKKSNYGQRFFACAAELAEALVTQGMVLGIVENFGLSLPDDNRFRFLLIAGSDIFNRVYKHLAFEPHIVKAQRENVEEEGNSCLAIVAKPLCYTAIAATTYGALYLARSYLEVGEYLDHPSGNDFADSFIAPSIMFVAMRTVEAAFSIAGSLLSRCYHSLWGTPRVARMDEESPLIELSNLGSRYT